MHCSSVEQEAMQYKWGNNFELIFCSYTVGTYDTERGYSSSQTTQPTSQLANKS